MNKHSGSPIGPLVIKDNGPVILQPLFDAETPILPCPSCSEVTNPLIYHEPRVLCPSGEGIRSCDKLESAKKMALCHEPLCKMLRHGLWHPRGVTQAAKGSPASILTKCPGSLTIVPPTETLVVDYRMQLLSAVEMNDSSKFYSIMGTLQRSIAHSLLVGGPMTVVTGSKGIGIGGLPRPYRGGAIQHKAPNIMEDPDYDSNKTVNGLEPFNPTASEEVDLVREAVLPFLGCLPSVMGDGKGDN